SRISCWSLPIASSNGIPSRCSGQRDNNKAAPVFCLDILHHDSKHIDYRWDPARLRFLPDVAVGTVGRATVSKPPPWAQAHEYGGSSRDSPQEKKANATKILNPHAKCRPGGSCGWPGGVLGIGPA